VCGTRAYNDALHGDKLVAPGADDIVQIMSKSFNMKPELVREMHSHAVDANGTVNAEGMQKDLDFFRQQGWVGGQIKAAEVIDVSFAQTASAELGPYRRKSQ
jgi:NitT/TauT family transport system substrate-binding protein